MESTQTEIELVSAILGPDVDIATTHILLHRFGNLAQITVARIEDLAGIIGNEAEAIRLRSLLKTAANFGTAIDIRHPVIGDCPSLVRYLQSAMGDCRVETFRVLFLDTHNKIIADEVMWSGTVSEVQIYPREVIRRALELDSSAFIAAHNHPSEIVTPSKSDVEMTRRLLEAAGVFNIAFHDHFIVSARSYHSMRFHESVTPWA